MAMHLMHLAEHIGNALTVHLAVQEIRTLMNMANSSQHVSDETTRNQLRKQR